MPFIQRVGIPSIDQAFVRNQHNPDPAYKNVGKLIKKYNNLKCELVDGSNKRLVCNISYII